MKDGKIYRLKKDVMAVKDNCLWDLPEGMIMMLVKYTVNLVTFMEVGENAGRFFSANLAQLSNFENGYDGGDEIPYKEFFEEIDMEQESV